VTNLTLYTDCLAVYQS